PRTSAGKARSAMNSTRHGLLGQFHLIEGEDEQEFSKFAEGIRAALKPVGAVEESYVDRLIKDTWLLNRFDNVQSALLVNQESPDDLSILELLTVIKFVEHVSGRRFDELAETENDYLAELSKAVASSSLGLTLFEHLADRFCKPEPAANKPRSKQAPAETGQAEGKRDASSTKAAVNTMARAFARKREAVALALRYRT